MDPLTAVAEGLEARLKTIDGLRTVPHVPDQINPPQAIIDAGSIGDYDEAMARGKLTFRPTIYILVSAAINRAGALKLYEYLAPAGPRSVFAAVMADPTLGGAASDLRFVPNGSRTLGLEEVGQIGYYGCRFPLEILATFDPS